jgi:RNA polymerase sigma factor (TIGR02999 family)
MTTESPFSMSEVAHVLSAPERSESRVAEDLLPALYQELRHLAAWHMSRERAGQTLQATALVHEAWLRVQVDEDQHWDNQRHFFAATAEAMRRILIDRARSKQAVRHGGGLHRTEVELENIPIDSGAPDEELIEVHQALDALAAHDARKAEVVKLRYFGGLTLEETAAALGLSVCTAKRDWAYARAWLFREIARRRA